MTTRAGEDVEGLEPSRTIAGDVKWCGCFGDSLAAPRTIKRSVSYGPAIPLRGVCPREMKTYVHTTTCACTFTAALFVIAKAGDDPSDQ